MEFADEILALAKRATELTGSIQTEEATKTALVLPMLRALGYDVFNPTEVVPEFTADTGTKKGEKVDYAIFNNKKLVILIECKKVGEALGANHANQLYRYFTSTEARFGILTDGVRYEFYSDLDDRNKMDNKPFFIFDLFSNSEADVKELKKFGKSKYAEEYILSSANNLKYARLIDAALSSEFDQPSDDLIKLIGGRVYEGRMTSGVLEWMGNLVKEALSRSIRNRVRAKLESALDKGNQQTEEDVEVEESLNNDEGIETTAQEHDAYNIIRAILAEVVEPDRIAIRDSKSYCAILFDDNNRRPVCRLYLDGKQWRIGLFEGKIETRNDIMNTSDIFHFATQLKATVTPYLED